MNNMLNGRLNVFRNHGLEIMSLCSLLVAALSLWFSIQAQKLDREYKEVSIRPELNLDVDPSRLTIGIRSVGLGPAKIKRVMIKTESACLDSTGMNAREWSLRAIPMLLDWARDFTDKVFTAELKARDRKMASYIVNVLSPTEILQSGATFSILEARYPSVVMSILEGESVESHNQIFDRFTI